MLDHLIIFIETINAATQYQKEQLNISKTKLNKNQINQAINNTFSNRGTRNREEGQKVLIYWQ